MSENTGNNDNEQAHDLNPTLVNETGEGVVTESNQQDNVVPAIQFNPEANSFVPQVDSVHESHANDDNSIIITDANDIANFDQDFQYGDFNTENVTNFEPNQFLYAQDNTESANKPVVLESNDIQVPEPTEKENEPQESSEIPPIVVDEPAPVTNGSEVQELAPGESGDMEIEEPNTSAIFQNPLSTQFATPLKSLPPLKDIEPITTPKSFSVAKDDENDTSNVQPVNSSPVVNQQPPKSKMLEADQENSILEPDNSILEPEQNSLLENTFTSNDQLEIIASFLNVDINEISSLEKFPDVLLSLRERASEHQQLKSELSFIKINQEQSTQIQQKKFKILTGKIEKLTEHNTKLLEENESLTTFKDSNNEIIQNLKEENSKIHNKLNEAEHSKTETEINYNNSISSRDQEVRKLNESNHKLTQANIDQTQQINKLSISLNDSNNEKFNLKFELTSKSNELNYFQNQKDWYEKELKSLQSKFSELIKNQESEYLTNSSKIASLTSIKTSLERTNKSKQEELDELQEKYELIVAKTSKLESTIEVEKIKYIKEISAKEELVEVTKIQSNERLQRIKQLEDYVEEVKHSLGSNISELTRELDGKKETIIILEEKLARVEDALGAELHKETELPKLTNSAELIVASSSANGLESNGISLSALYSEFNYLKKQLVLERSQKEKLADQLQLFVAELESKKPALANYREQIKFYENSLKEMIGKVETIRSKEQDSLKESSRLRLRLSEYETELRSLKQLSKDLGKQLCYYLIHTKVKEGNDDPLTLSERKAIENILNKSGNMDEQEESDSDKLISERLLGFVDIIELQHKNQDLLVVIRQLTQQLESKEQESGALESSAIEEAKDAILTLQGELDTVHLKYDAAVKERDLLKGIGSNGSINGSATGALVAGSGGEMRLLTDSNHDLKNKLDETEKLLKDLQAQSSDSIKKLSLQLNEAKNDRDEARIQLSTSKHSVDLTEARLQTCKKSLENSNSEIEHLRTDIKFWKDQVSKQEKFAVQRFNEAKDLETRLSEGNLTINNLTNQLQIVNSSQRVLKEEINQLRNDKVQLSEYLKNLQSFIKEKENVNEEIKSRAKEIEQQYKDLKSEINEKEERIKILSSQSELAINAQNAKLEQVNELGQQLLDAKSKLLEKQKSIDSLKHKITQLETVSIQKEHRSSIDGSSLDSSEKSRLLLEYEHLKKEFQLAQEQVEEFTKIAQSAEQALINATESFDNYRLENEAKQNTLVQEKNSLAEQVTRLNGEVDTLRQTITSNEQQKSVELEGLRGKLLEFESKAKSYDNLKQDYETRLGTVTQELQSQGEINNNTQKKYEEKLAENEQLNQEISNLKSISQGLEQNISDLSIELATNKKLLDEKDEFYVNEKNSIVEELKTSLSKVQELKDQYNIILNQLELTKKHTDTSAISDDSSSQELREVISYLRREKESADAQTLVANEAQNRLQKQLEQVTIELEATKSQLNKLQPIAISIDDANNEHERLKEQLQQLNILRESNVTLRNENSTYFAKLEKLQKELDEVRNNGKPATSTIDSVDNDQELKDQQIRLLTEENDRLKVQLGNDEELTKMIQRFENLKTEFKSKLLVLRNKNKDLEKQVEESKAMAGEVTTSKLNDELSKAEALKNESIKKVESLTKEKENLEALIKSLKDQQANVPDTTQVEGELSKLKEQFSKDKATYEAQIKQEFDKKLQEELSKIPSSQGESENEIRTKVENEWKQKVDTLEKSVNAKKQELETKYANELQAKLKEQLNNPPNQNNESFEVAKKELVGKYEEEINGLKKTFENQLSKEKVGIEKKYEFKLRVLTRKLEKLEKQQEPKISAEVPAQAAEASVTSSPAPSSLPAMPGQAPVAAAAAPISAKPLGHQFTESTLSVHRPNVDRPKVNKPEGSNIGANNNNNNNNHNNNRKRPFVNKIQNSNKKPNNQN